MSVGVLNTTEKIKKYFETDAVSQSQLTNFSIHPKYYKNRLEKDIKESDALRIGSAVDCLLTDKDSFHNRFYIFTEEKPSGQMEVFIDSLLSGDSNEVAYTKARFKRDGLNKVIERFEKEGKKYYNAALKSVGKIVLSFEAFEKVNKIVDSLFKNNITKQYIYPEEGSVYYQEQIYFKYNGIDCKALLDIIIVNHINKTIQPCDIKTTGYNVTKFPESIIRFRYDLQAAWYSTALLIWQMNLKNSKIKDYKILPFKFIVESTEYPGNPIIYTLSAYDLECAAFGGTLRNGVVLKGFNQLIDELKWHTENDLWDYPKEVYDNKCDMTLNIYE